MCVLSFHLIVLKVYNWHILWTFVQFWCYTMAKSHLNFEQKSKLKSRNSFGSLLVAWVIFQYKLIHHRPWLSHFSSDSSKLYRTKFRFNFLFIALGIADNTEHCWSFNFFAWMKTICWIVLKVIFRSIFGIRIKIISKVHAIFGSLCYHLF